MVTAAKLEKPADTKSWKEYFLPTAVALLALGLRIPMLGRNGLWLDEGVSASIAQLPWVDFFKLLWRREANMGLYYLLLRGWSTVGEGEFAIRALSVVFGVASVIAVWALGKRLFGSQAGLLAALLLAVNAFHLRYSQQARSYSLLILLLTVSAYWLARTLEDPSKRNQRLYLTASSLVFYAHFFAILVIAAQFASLLLLGRERRRNIPAGKMATWLAFLCAPGILFLLLKNQGQLDWIPPLTPHVLYDSLVLFTGQGGLWLLLAYVAACGFAAIALVRRTPGAEATRFAYAFAATWLLVPIALLILASMVKPVFAARYLTLSLPALVLLAAAGLQRLSPSIRTAGAVFLVALSLLGVRNYYAGLAGEREEWRELTQFIVGKSTAGDGLVFDNGISRPVFEHYRAGVRWPRVVFPEHGNELTYRDFEGIATPQVIASKTATAQRLWLVTRAASPALELALGEAFSKVDEREFRGARVQLYARPQK